MEILKKAKETWGAFGEWASIVGPIVGLFLYLHHENNNLTNRLDSTNSRIDETNKRIDTNFIEINKRADILHNEFIDLLKERRDK